MEMKRQMAITISCFLFILLLGSQLVMAEGGKIAFCKFLDDHSQIFVVDENGQNEINLSENKLNDSDPVWSPDGKYIAFASDKNKNDARRYEIYIMDADGSHRRRITNDEAFDSYMPSFSPDGIRLAFTRVALQNGNSTCKIFIAYIDGRQEAKFLTDGTSPSWSPDGKKIAFFKPSPNIPDIFLIDTDGKNQVNVTNRPDSADGLPVWSPDGKQIGFTSNAPLGGFSQIFNLYKMDADGGNVVRLTNNEDNEEYDSRTWLPNGQYILFEIWNIFDNTHKIAMIKADGSDMRIICDGSNPSWFDPDFAKQVSPSGKLTDTWGGIKRK